jgi:hypothetical protein
VKAKRGGRLVQKELRSLSTSEIAAFKRQINSPLLKRFLVTIDELNDQIAERDRQLENLRGARRHQQ